MLIPIGTDVRLARPPLGNWGLIVANVLVFVFADGMDNAELSSALPALHAAVPAWHEYLTYQFRHGDVMHLVGNMIFLWIFGNAVCDRMGSLPYVVFYLAAGVFSGVVFASTSNNDIVGASGAIAAVTTAFLAFYPRVHITLLIWLGVVFLPQLPAMLVIVGKIIVWDNLVAPSLDRGMASNVAYSAHLGGYAFGFLVSMGLLALQALPRNQFDLLAIIKRWRRRASVADILVDAPIAARPVVLRRVESRPLAPPPIEQRLRDDILDRIAERDLDEAARLFEQLISVDPAQVLPRDAQLDVANHLWRMQRFGPAVSAYEAFLAAYPGAADAPQVALLAGMLCNRYLNDPARAVPHLAAAAESVAVAAQREMALQELEFARQRGG